MTKIKNLRITDKDTVAHSQWPWKKQEIGTIVFFFLLPLILLAVLLITGDFSWAVFGPVLTGGVIAGGALSYLGHKRKKGSRFTGVLSPDSKLQVKGKIPSTNTEFASKILLDDVRSVAVKPLGINAAFVLHARNEKDDDVSLVLPYRLAYTDELREKVVECLEGAQKTPEAEDFLDRLKNGEKPSNYKREIRAKTAGEESEWKKAAQNL